MKLRDLISQLEAIPEDATIYAQLPWTPESEAVLAIEPEDPTVPPPDVEYPYFLEVFIAKEFLEGWLGNCKLPPTLQEQSVRLIQYATMDA